jgi:hypothetical protein
MTAVRPSRQSSPERLSPSLRRVDLFAVGVEHAGQRRLEAGLVHAALRGVDVVGEGDDDLVVAVVPLHGNLGHAVVLSPETYIDDPGAAAPCCG